MRKFLSLMLLLLLVPFPALGEETTVAGYVMAREPFYEMETSFREQTFSGETISIELTDTQTLIFTSEAAARMLPSLTVMIQQAVPLAEDVDGMVSITQSLLETMQGLQTEHPEAFLFNDAMAMEHAETGFHFAVAEPDIWLWAQDGSAVMLPIYFYDGESGALIDGVYLLTIVIVGPQSAYYALYSSAAVVLDYVMRVEIASDRSGFQLGVVQWYLANFVDQETTAPPDDGAETEGLGSVRITVKSGFARAEGNTDADALGSVRKDEVYEIHSLSDSGWYEITLESGKQAFISPALGETVE